MTSPAAASIPRAPTSQRSAIGTNDRALLLRRSDLARLSPSKGCLARAKFWRTGCSGVFSDERDWPQLVHIATDGESYGHHHRYGEMALAYALEPHRANEPASSPTTVSSSKNTRRRIEVEIIENTSWSCVSRRRPLVERLRLQLRRPRAGTRNGAGRCVMRLDWLRDEVAPPFEKARQFFQDPWAARNDYISVVLDRARRQT